VPVAAEAAAGTGGLAASAATSAKYS
jgi:hypothetical protein